MPVMILGEIGSRCSFTWWLRLSMWGLMWTGLPTLCTILWFIAVRWRAMPSTRRCLVLSLQWAVAFYGGCEAPMLGEWTASVPALPNLTWGKSFLPWYAYPMVGSSWHLGVYSWSICCVRQRWDRFSTWVHIVRRVWATEVTSLHARLIRPPLPEVLGSTTLICCWEPEGMLDRRPRSASQIDKRSEEGRYVVKFSLSTLIVGWRSDVVHYS
jgi:hypothetical protein